MIQFQQIDGEALETDIYGKCLTDYVSTGANKSKEKNLKNCVSNDMSTNLLKVWFNHRIVGFIMHRGFGKTRSQFKRIIY